MIRLTKGNQPRVLANNAANWTSELLAKRASNPQASARRHRYGHPEVRAALQAETHGKCAYCESRSAPVAPLEVEHMAPQSVFPDRSYDWWNLTFACRARNLAKSGYWDEALPLLDPYVDDPRAYLRAVGTLILA